MKVRISEENQVGTPAPPNPENEPVMELYLFEDTTQNKVYLLGVDGSGAKWWIARFGPEGVWLYSAIDKNSPGKSGWPLFKDGTIKVIKRGGS